MTHERAYYYKLMLEVSLTDSFDRKLDELLEKEAFLESFRKQVYHGEVFDPVDAQRQKLYQNTLIPTSRRWI